jgi:hypothetical protein
MTEGLIHMAEGGNAWLRVSRCPLEEKRCGILKKKHT